MRKLTLTLLFFISFTKCFGFSCSTQFVRKKQGEIYLNYQNHTPQLYFIHNRSLKPILLNHIKKNIGAGAGWASQLQANHWSIISVTNINFKLSCYQLSNYAGQKTISCRDIEVCRYSNQKHHPSGDYWVIENKTMKEVMRF